MNAGFNKSVFIKVESVGKYGQTEFQKKFLILQGIVCNGLSNQRFGLLDAIALAIVSQRMLVIPSHSRYCKSSLSEIYDFERLQPLVTVIEDQAFNYSSCHSEGQYLVYESRLQSLEGALCSSPGVGEGQTMSGIRWHTTSTKNLPKQSAEYSMVDLFTKAPYDQFPPYFQSHDLKEFITDPLFPISIQQVNYSCTMIQGLYLSFNWAEAPALLSTIQGSLMPSKSISSVVDQFLSNHSLTPHSYVGVHIRSFQSNFVRTCIENRDQIVAVVKELIASTGSSNATLLYGIDHQDASKACIQTLSSLFETSIEVSSGVFDPESCNEAAFVQEVLAMSSAFMGNEISTFSITVNQIRIARYKYPMSSSKIW
jgi:GDP-fucose protein O-fucosyltransferase